MGLDRGMGGELEGQNREACTQPGREAAVVLPAADTLEGVEPQLLRGGEAEQAGRVRHCSSGFHARHRHLLRRVQEERYGSPGATWEE